MALGLLVSMESYAAKAKAKKEDKPLPVLNKWFALGSGCKSKQEEVGDVTVSDVPLDAKQPNTYRMKFHLPKYELNFPALDPKTKKLGNATARECAIRLNINPPAGKTIKTVTATTALTSSKTAGVELTTYVGLKLGVVTIGSALTKHEMPDSFTNKQEEVVLVPGRKPEEMFPELKCGEPKIIGVDFTFMARGENTNGKASAALAGEKVLEIVADLADCK